MTATTMTAMDGDPREAEAVEIAMRGSRWQRLKVALPAIRALLRDTEDTQQVFLLSVALNADHIPRILARFLADDDGLELMREQPAIDSRDVDFDALRALPADTLGGAYVRFLDEHGLDPDLFRAPPGMPRAVAYLSQRFRQSHDLWHVLTGYRTDVPGELSVLAFSWAQTGMPAVRLIVLAGALRHGNPRIWREIVRAYRRGQRARFLGNQRWEAMWERPLAEVRADLNL